MISSIWMRAVRGLDSHAFVRLIQTHALSAAGDGLVTVALAGSVFFNEDPGTARSRVAFSLILTVTPFALVAPFLGPAIDRASGGRRLILLCASAARALLCLLMASSLNSVALYPVAFLSLVFSKAHAVAKSASVPELVESESALVRANSVLAISAVLSGFVAATLGFGVSKVAGSEWVLRAGAVIFACAAALAFETGSHKSAQKAASRAETTREILSSGVLYAGTVMAVLRASVGFLTFLIAFDLRRSGAPTWWFGVAIVASMIGSSLGNVVAPRLRGHVREERILAGSVILMAAASLSFAQNAGRLSAAFLALVLGACAAAGKLSFDSLVQRDAPAAVQGRSFARFEAVFQFVWVLGALVPVSLSISNQLGFWLLGLGSAAIALWYLLLAPRAKARRG